MKREQDIDLIIKTKKKIKKNKLISQKAIDYINKHKRLRIFFKRDKEALNFS